MKTFKLLFMLLMMVVCSVGFTSCSNDDEVADGSSVAGILGTWVQEEENTKTTFTFNKDGSGSKTEEETDKKGNIVETETKVFDYTYDSEKHTLMYNEKGSTTVYKYEATLTGHTLMLEWGDLVYILKRK